MTTCGHRGAAGYDCTGPLGHGGDCSWPVDRWIDGVAYREERRHHSRTFTDATCRSTVPLLTITYVEVPDPPERP